MSVRNGQWWWVALVVVSMVTGIASAGAGGSNPWADGMWKSPPVPERPEGEFGNHDPYGLAIGVPIRTDCSIRWIWEGRLYCFNSLTSKAFVIERPVHYLERARAFYDSEAFEPAR